MRADRTVDHSFMAQYTSLSLDGISPFPDQPGLGQRANRVKALGLEMSARARVLLDRAFAPPL